MANNVFADIPAAVVAKTSISFASAGLDATKVRIIYEVGDPLKSFIPGRAINAISGFTQDKGYYIVPLISLDLSAILAPPLDAANITPPAPTAGVVDDTANTFDWTNAAGYVTADHETSINGGTTWTAATKPLSVGNVALAIGQVMVRVKAATGRNAGPTLANSTAFTVAATDTTAPTVTSATAINATTIRVVFSEVVTDSITAGSIAFKKNGAANNPTARTGSGTNTIDYTVPTMAAGDTILRSYVVATGDIKDAAGNEMAAFTDVAVTNSISGGTFSNTNRLAFYKNTSMVRSGGKVTKWTNADGNTAWDFSQYSLSVDPIDATTEGMQITSTENLKTAAQISQAYPITIYALMKKTANGGAILANTVNGNGYGFLIDAATMYISWGNPASYYYSANAGIAIMSVFKVVTITWAGPGNAPKVYLDGTLITATWTENGGGSPAGNFLLDYLMGYGSNLFKGNINGLAVFNALHDAATVAAQTPLFKTAAEA